MSVSRMIAVTLLLGATACGGSEQRAAAPAPSTTGAPPLDSAPAGPPAVGIYVTNETGGDLTVIDGATNTVVATIPLGKRPRGIVASPNRELLYVALSGSPIGGPNVDESKLPPPDRSADGIGVVDVRQRKLLKVLPSGPDPEQVDVSPDGKEIVFDSDEGGQVDIFVQPVDDGPARRLTNNREADVLPSFSRDGKWVYFASERSGTRQIWRVPAMGGAEQQRDRNHAGDTHETSRRVCRRYE